jgi:hypothetical protein
MKELVHIVNEITYKHVDNMESFNDKFCTIWNITKRARPSSDLKAKTLNHFKKYNKMNDIKTRTWMNINIERGPA